MSWRLAFIASLYVLEQINDRNTFKYLYSKMGKNSKSSPVIVSLVQSINNIPNKIMRTPRIFRNPSRLKGHWIVGRRIRRRTWKQRYFKIGWEIALVVIKVLGSNVVYFNNKICWCCFFIFSIEIHCLLQCWNLFMGNCEHKIGRSYAYSKCSSKLAVKGLCYRQLSITVVQNEYEYIVINNNSDKQNNWTVLTPLQLSRPSEFIRYMTDS